MAISDKKILVVGSYPITKPRHGGQKRVDAIIREYRSHFKEVRYVAVYSRWANPDAARSDVPVSHQTDGYIIDTPRVEEIICGEAIFNEPKVKRRMADLLTSFKPDIIQVEQVYPFLGLKPLLEELHMDPKIVFDAHNVESKMKPDIYRKAGLAQSEIKPLVAHIASLEESLAKRAALTVTVTAADKADFETIGAQKVTIAENGIYPSPGTPKQLQAWKKHFKEGRIAHTFLYVASAHLPNWTSFQQVVGDGLGFIPPDTRIVFAGGLSDYLATRHKWPETPGAATFWNRAEAAGILTEDSLGSLIQCCEVIILPIAAGGGSNLKTAEALVSGKPIVATSFAFRAYEQFMDYPTVTIANSPADFRRAMQDALVTPPVKLTASQQASVTEVTWPRRLSKLAQEVSHL